MDILSLNKQTFLFLCRAQEQHTVAAESLPGFKSDKPVNHIHADFGKRKLLVCLDPLRYLCDDSQIMAVLQSCRTLH